MAKLSGHQREVLKRMEGGDEIWTTSGIYSSCFWQSSVSDKSPGMATVEALRCAGHIHPHESDFNGRKYRISDLGRAALRVRASVGEPS